MNFTKLALTAFTSSSIAFLAHANTEPTVIVNSAAMRDGTTLMDISYRVNDPDDATVKVRALAFEDGVRSFANVLRPVTFAEGTDANIGDSIPTNTDHPLTWDVGADWDVDLGQVKFEVLAQDSRGLLEFDWITIPAAGEEAELTISQNSPTKSEVLDALFWLYANDHPTMNLTEGSLTGSSTSGFYNGTQLATGSNQSPYSYPFLFNLMGLDAADSLDKQYAEYSRAFSSLAGLKWHATDRPFSGTSIIYQWGKSDKYADLYSLPIEGLSDIKSITLTNSSIYILFESGTAHRVAQNGGITDEMSDVTQIDGDPNSNYVLFLKKNGTVQTTSSRLPPHDLKDVIQVAAGNTHALALKSDGTVVAWGDNIAGSTDIPEGLNDVISIAAGTNFSVALKSDGSLVQWGGTVYTGSINGLSNVKSITGGSYNVAVIFNDDTATIYGNSRLRISETNVSSIALGPFHGLILKKDGNMIAVGGDTYGATDIPDNLREISIMAVGYYHMVVASAKPRE